MICQMAAVRVRPKCAWLVARRQRNTPLHRLMLVLAQRLLAGVT